MKVTQISTLLIIFLLFRHQAGAQCLFVTNPGFESGMTAWAQAGVPASSTISTSGPHSGSQFLLINSGYSAGISNTITGFTVGQKYVLSGWFKGTAGASWATFGIEWANGSGTTIQAQNITLRETWSNWTNQYLVVTAPAGAVSARLTVWKNGVAGTISVDDICMTVAPPDCGILFTTTNATSPFNADGRIEATNIDGYQLLMAIGLVGEPKEGIPGDGSNLASRARYYTGLRPGTYEIDFRITDTSFSTICLGSRTIVVGSNALPTCLGTTVGGSIYGDYNQSGARDVKERGLAGFVVNAYNTAGALSATATSTADGNYQLTGLASGQPYRLEFTWPDGHIRPGAIGASQATVQFVNAGTCSANLGVNYPRDYCQTNDPYLTMSCFVNGNPTAPAVAPLDAMVANKLINTTQSLTTTAFAPVIHVSTAGQLGSVWAQAYQPSSKYVFTSAALRRYMGFGPLGTGGIYKVDMTTPATPTTTPWLNLNTIGIPTGTDPRNGTPANILSTSPGSPAYDTDAYDLVGKMSIGGMDFSDFGDTLWLVNLFDRKLYGIRNVSPSVTPVAGDVLGGYPITMPSGFACPTNSNDIRPWGVKYYKGKVYVGVVCSGEATPAVNSISAFVLSFDPTNPGAGFTHIIDFPLDYIRYGYGGGAFTFDSWQPLSTGKWWYITQPLLTDLEFDINGDLIIGVGDRGGLQTGYQNYRPDPTATSTTFVDGNSYGETVRACKTASGYIKEGLAGCPLPTAPVSPNNLHPGIEFYWGEHGPFADDFQHFEESSMGALAQIAIQGLVVITAQDPTTWHAGGTIALNNTVGGDLYRYSVYDVNSPGGAGKSAGLGDIEPLCDYAPIEIGERVFMDTDNDGIQDANEAGINNVTVQLFRTSDNALIGTTTTNALGIYKFTNLVPNTGYYVSISTSQAALSSLWPTTANAGANDNIDSDGAVVGATVRTSLTTGQPGYNNHTYDFGFNGCAPYTTSLGSAQTVCTGASITLTPVVTGGTPAYSYAWSGGLGTGSPKVITATVTDTYTVTVTDALFCTSTASVTITVVADPTVSITANTTDICVGGAATLTATPVGGVGTCTLQWQSNTGSGWVNISGANANTYSPSGLGANTDYRVVYSCSAAGCCN